MSQSINAHSLRQTGIYHQSLDCQSYITWYWRSRGCVLLHVHPLFSTHPHPSKGITTTPSRIITESKNTFEW